jgi:hypothetical protein
MGLKFHKGDKQIKGFHQVKLDAAQNLLETHLMVGLLAGSGTSTAGCHEA